MNKCRKNNNTLKKFKVKINKNKRERKKKKTMGKTKLNPTEPQKAQHRGRSILLL